MKVNEVNIGNGIFRLEIEPTCSCEKNIPTRVVDSIIKDVIMRKNSNKRVMETNFCHEPMNGIRSFEKPIFTKERREPDGIDIHVDRPLRENFMSHGGWANAMAKYRTLERVAKDCNWECREPMKTLPNYRNLSTRMMDDFDELDFVLFCDEPWM